MFRLSLVVVTLALSLNLLPPCALAAPLPRTVQKASSSEKELRSFLLSTKGTYGWQPAKGTISYDFLPDGRLHVQGSDGEATMWEGKWRLETGNRLTLTYNESKKTVSAEVDGDALLLDGKRYTRYRP